MRQQIENEQLKVKLSDLQNQIKFYEESKNEYMKKSASADEVSEYTELMDKLSLLQEESRNESAKLRKQVLEANAKEKALNKYQQMVRNIINQSKFEKVKVTNRDTVIGEQVGEIENQNLKIDELKNQVKAKQQELANTEQQMSLTSSELNKQKAELANALKHQKITKKIYEKKLAAAKIASETEMKALQEKQEAYQRQLGDLSGKMAYLDEKLKGANSELANKESQLRQTRGVLEATKGSLETAQGELNSAKGQLNSAKGQLAKAQAEIDARKSVAKQIKASFAAKGIKAEVDMDSGEVYLDFGQSYFENGSAKLKKEMKDVIEKAVPIYAQSLLGNPKIADKVSNVEIIGFASPTYKGKFVDPSSTKPTDQEALKYNMDLSYQRAKSIFNYVLDESRMNFKYQRDLTPLLKVSGRSFLETAKVNRSVASEDFCKVNDCKKAQRVVIRFSMDKKK